MEYDVKGIDINGINKMVSAVNTYKKNVTKLVKDITSVPSSMVDKAIKGTNAQSAYKSAVANLKQNAENIIKQMDQFATVLNNEIRDRYNNGEASISTTSFGAVK